MADDIGAEYDAMVEQEARPEPVEEVLQEVSQEVETESEPQHEQEEVYYGPSWFNEIESALNSSDPSYTMPAVPDMPQDFGHYMPPQAPQGYPQPQGQPPQQGGDPRYRDIDGLFDNPRQFIASVVQDSINRSTGAVAGKTQRELAKIQHANASNAMYNIKQSVDMAYQEQLNRDNSYRANESVRRLVDGTLENMTMRAANAAYNGNFGPARMFSNPKLYRGVLAAAKAVAGVGGVNPEPAVPVGGQTGRVASRQEQGGSKVQLPPDLEEVARSVNRPGFREELEKEYAEAMRLGDISWR